MTSLHHAQAKGNLGPFDVRTPGANPRNAKPPLEEPWVVRKVVPLRDGSGNPITPELEKLQTILEAIYRDNPHAWPSTATLATLYGCKRRNMQLLLEKGEKAGLLLRVIEGKGRASRVGLLAFRRFDPRRPVIADNPEAISRAIVDLKARRFGKAQSIAPFFPSVEPLKAQCAAPLKAQRIAPEERGSSKEDENVNVGENVNVASPPEGGRKELDSNVARSPVGSEISAGPAALESPESGNPPQANPPTEEELEWALTYARHRHRSLRDTALRQLEKWGKLPPDLVGKVPPPLPADVERDREPPAEKPRYFVPTPQPPPDPSTIEDMIRRLPGSNHKAELAREIASRWASKWGDPGSLYGFISQLLKVANGEIPAKSALMAFRKAEKCGPDARPGAIFNHWLGVFQNGST